MTGRGGGRARRSLRVAGKILAVILASALVFELLLVITDLDLRVIGAYVYRNEGNRGYTGTAPLYRPAQNPERIYELVPGVSTGCDGCAHPLEPKYDQTVITINSLGFRGREVSEIKPPEVFRVVILGGSNTFGVSVSDGDTFPAQMQARLERLGHTNVEIWNAGTNAYVISQKVAWLEEIAARYTPDLVLIQDHNLGWRPLLRGEDEILDALRADRALVVEAHPPARGEPHPQHPTPHWVVPHRPPRRPGDPHVLYARLRAACEDSEQETFGCLTEDWRQRFRAVSERRSVAAFDAFMSETSLPVVLVDTTDGRYCPGTEHHDRLGAYPTLQTYSLCDDSKPDEYRHIHPPSYVYEWYAERLVDDVILPALEAQTQRLDPN